MENFADYLKINQDFIPVYTLESDKAHGDAWKSFIPQESMHGVLRDLIKALDGAKVADRKSLWITGSYGTGKTYAAFVIKHLLEDSVEDISPWFQRYPVLQDLWSQFQGLRLRKKCLVPVFRSSSSAIRGDNRLFIEIQRAIRQTLRERGFSYLGGPSLYEQVIEKTCSPISSFNFDNAFGRHTDIFEGHYTRAQDVLTDLRAKPEDAILLGNVLEVLEREGQYLDSNVDDIKLWLKDVIDGNGLDAIVFLWDEFTDYFRNNAAVSALQEIAHAAYGNTPFYFVLITHRRMEQFGQLDSDARKTLQARFFIHNLTMSDVTSYQLMANALERETALTPAWEAKRTSLWDTVRPVFTGLRSGMGLQSGEYKESHFAGLVPLHPYSAFLLTQLSAQFSANQRTMFSFLQAQGGTEERPDFNWFISHHGPESQWKWLTPDYLWDYFSVQDNIELDDGTQERVAYYLNNVSRLEGDERRIFKAAMLLLVLELRAAGVKLLQPYISNLEMMFRGTDLTPLHVRHLLFERLEKEGILQLTELANDQWQISLPMFNVDRERLAKIKESKSRDWSFEICTGLGRELHEAALRISTQDAPNRRSERYLVRCASHMNATATLANLSTALRQSQIGVLILLQLDPGDGGPCQRFIEQKMLEKEYSRIAFVRIVHPVGTGNWERWQEAKAREVYAAELHDRANAQVYADRANKVITDWLAHARISQNRVFSNGQNAQFTANYWDAADRFAAEVFPAGMERLTTNDNLYSTTISENVAKLGLGQVVSSSIAGRFEALIKQMKSQFIWDDPSLLATRPDHPLARARRCIADALENSSPRAARLVDIWETLQREPYGYLSIYLASFLLGYLFKEYVGRGYYINDGRNTSIMSVEGIAAAVENLLKGKGGFYSISRMKQEHIFLCNQCARIFVLKPEQASTLQELRKHVRARVSDLRYPLWIAVYSETVPAYQQAFFAELFAFLNQEDETQQLEYADRLYALLTEHPQMIDEASRLLRPDRFTGGMNNYLYQRAPQTVSFVLERGQGMDWVREMVRSRISESGYWLWDRQRFDDELKNLEQETQLVKTASPLLDTPANTLSLVKVGLKGRLGRLKVPIGVFERRNLVAGMLLRRLWRFANDQKLEDTSTFEAELSGNTDTIRSLIDNEAAILQDYLKERFGAEISLEAIRADLLSKLPLGCLDMEEGIYWSRVDHFISEMKASRAYRELSVSWRGVSGYENPAICSSALNLPVAWLPVMQNEEGRALIAMLDGRRPQELSDIENLQAWIADNRGRLEEQVQDRELHERLWLEDIVGIYSAMVPDSVTLTQIISELPHQFGSDVHSWAFKRSEIHRLVQDMMRYLYGKNGKPQVQQRIDQLDAEDCKRYLKRLVEASEMVGLAILEDARQRG